MTSSELESGIVLDQEPLDTAFQQVTEENTGSEPDSTAADSEPKPAGLGQPRRVQPIPFAQEILPGMEDFIVPSADEDSGNDEPTSERVSRPSRKSFEYGVAIATAMVISAALGFGSAVFFGQMRAATETVREVVKTVVKEVAVDPEAIPVELLGDSRDAACWKTVANMKGKIGNAELAFSRGRASADGTDYRVVLEFAREGETTFTKVAGNGLWIVKVDSEGNILRAYRCPRADRSLNSIVGQ